MATQRVLALALSLAAGAAAAQDGRPGYANIVAQRLAGGAGFTLHVDNRAGVAVRLMGCPGPTVLPGKSLAVPLAGLSRFWVVPEGVEVDCHAGPFAGLYYFDADFLGDQPLVSVGYTPSTTRKPADNAAEAGQLVNATRPSIAGVQLTGGTPGNEVAFAVPEAERGAEQNASAPGSNVTTEANATTASEHGLRGVRCRQDGCDRSASVTAFPSELTLSIMAPRPSLLSFWGDWDDRRGGGWGRGGGDWDDRRGGDWDDDRGRWGHGGWGHHGHHGWGHGGWGGWGGWR